MGAFSIHFDAGWGVAVIMLSAIVLLISLFVAVNVFAYKHAKRNAFMPKPNIVTLTINGVLRYNTRANSGYQKLMAQIAWIKKTKPKAVIVQVNSPGGSTGASHEIYESLKSIREAGIILVVHMLEVAASGGVYIAMAATKIVATPGTITGSIGVVMPHFDFSELVKFLKVKPDSVTAGSHKEIGSSMKPMTKEGRELIAATLADVHQAFCEIVANGRGLDINEVRKFADGRIFSAAQAKCYGLIDEIGGYETAERIAIQMSKLNKDDVRVGDAPAPVPLLERFGLLPGVTSLVGRAEDLVATAESPGTPMFLWKG